MLKFENKGKLADLLGGIGVSFQLENLKFTKYHFLITHLTVQAAAEVSGYNVQYLRQLFRAVKVKGDKIDQSWLIRKES